MANTYFFTGGGTGGHIYPAVAVANELIKKDESAKIYFVGARRGIEKRIFPELNFDYHLLFVGPLNSVGLFRKLLSLMQLPFAVLYSIFLLFLHSPKAVVGFGGYASSPMIIAAKLLGKKFFLWEGNATPGMVTRKVISDAEKIFLAFPSKSKIYENYDVEVVGVPTRFESEESKRSYDEASSRKARLFVFGGSQGAAAINLVLSDFFSKNHEYSGMLEVVHQVGKAKQNQVSEDLKKLENYNVYEFIHDMTKYYQWADFVICRAGASTVSEINQMGLPAIFIPLPTAADNHQKKNAEWVSKSEAGKCIEQKDLNEQVLKENLDYFLKVENLKTMSEKSYSIAQKGAAKKIAAAIS